MTDVKFPRTAALLLPAIIVLGLALRIAAAQGGLWLDEAWSAKLAHDAGTPLGIFLNINHDNNHHLNSLWLQLVGFDAAPVLQRALSIVTGTGAIWVAARIAAPRGALAAHVAALLFAVSPALVTYGSEARGYAPMVLALLAGVLLVDRHLSGTADGSTRRRLAWCFALGALAQLTMVFGCVALIGWCFFALARRGGVAAAIRPTITLFAPALVALLLVLGIVFGAAYASPTGFQFGRYEAFDFLLYLHGLIEMLGYTIGVPVVSLLILALAAAAVVLARGARTARFDFYWIAILAFPIGMAVLRAGNVGNPRYFMLAAVALLMLLAELIARPLAAPGWRRLTAAVVLIGFVFGSAVQDVDLIRNQRGDPAAAIRAMHARAPAGAVIVIERDTALAMIQSAAAHTHYPLVVAKRGCPAPRFLFVDRFKGEALPASAHQCGRAYRLVAERLAHGMSGTHWALFDAEPSTASARFGSVRAR